MQGAAHEQVLWAGEMLTAFSEDPGSVPNTYVRLTVACNSSSRVSDVLLGTPLAPPLVCTHIIQK